VRDSGRREGQQRKGEGNEGGERGRVKGRWLQLNVSS